MKPQTLKAFDIEAAKAGAAVVTRDGRPARILATDLIGNCDEPVAAAVLEGDYEWVSTWKSDGSYTSQGDHHHDLFMAPVQRTVWVPLYRSSLDPTTLLTGSVYDTLEQAERTCAGLPFIGIFPITYEE